MDNVMEKVVNNIEIKSGILCDLVGILKDKQNMTTYQLGFFDGYLRVLSQIYGCNITRGIINDAMNKLKLDEPCQN